MKKLISSLLCFLMLFSLASCNKTDERVLLTGQKGITEVVELKTDELIAKINNAESFLLIGYATGCLNCKAFIDIVNDFVKEHEVVIYKGYATNLPSIDKRIPSVAPSMTIYDQGELKEVFSYNKYQSIFREEKEFKTFMNEHFILPSMKTISFTELDDLLANKESFLVYFGWYACGDCTHMNEAYLNEFLKDNDKEFYYVETDLYRKDKENNQEAWEAFSNKYGFGSYLDGRIPSLVYYENGVKKDMAVYFNDSYEWYDDDSLKVIDSYYQDNPFIGKTFSSYFDYQKECEAFFNKKISEFLKTYLK